jgi:tripartite ATP-independent transporter DctP family solute receptor
MKASKLLASIAVVIAGTVVATASYSQTVLKLSHTDQLTGGRHAASLLFAKKVEEYTQGRYQVRVFCCGQLGNDAKGLEQVVAGGLDFVTSGVGTWAAYLPLYNVAMMPYLFDTLEQGWKWYDESKWVKALDDKAPAKGFRVLGPLEAGFRNVTTKAPVNSPADAKGKKMRVAPTEMMLWTMEAMGFGGQIIPITEVYMSIQQGVVAGQDNPIDTIYSNKFYEVAPHITITNHLYSPLSLAVSEKVWQKFSPADQEAIMRAMKDTTAFSRNFVKETDEKMLAEMTAKGAKVNRTPDIAAFRKSVESVYARARDKFGAADVDQVLSETEAVRKAVK